MNQQEIQAILKKYVNVPTQFSNFNGITVTHIDETHSRGQLDVCLTSLNPGGKVHGGALMTLADTVAGAYVGTIGGSCVTSNANMEFLRPADGPCITCTATPKKLGRAISVMALTLTDTAGKVVATGTYTFFMLSNDPATGHKPLDSAHKPR